MRDLDTIDSELWLLAAVRPGVPWARRRGVLYGAGGRTAGRTQRADGTVWSTTVAPAHVSRPQQTHV